MRLRARYCRARPSPRFGSSTDLTAPKFDFRFTPESGLKSDISPCLFRAKSRSLPPTTRHPSTWAQQAPRRLGTTRKGLMLTEAAQFEMADFKDRCRNFCGKSTSHEQWPANILAEGAGRHHAGLRSRVVP